LRLAIVGEQPRRDKPWVKPWPLEWCQDIGGEHFIERLDSSQITRIADIRGDCEEQRRVDAVRDDTTERVG
jgi:hypothetical protein